MEITAQKETQPRYTTRDRIQTVYNASVPDLVITQARTDGFVFGQQIAYTCNATGDSLSFDGAVVELKQTYSSQRHVEVIFRFANGVLHLALRGNSLTANAFAVSDEAANGILDLVREQIPASNLDNNVIEIAFWHHHPKIGPLSQRRPLACPTWDEIHDNYAHTTRSGLERLLANNTDSSLAGKLILWHGEPGTGKTFALRAWSRTCRDCLNVNYIVDPEMFFGGNANYMVELLTMAHGEKVNLFVAEDTAYGVKGVRS